MQEIEHKEIINLIPAHALNSLDAGEAEVVARHMASCAECRAELAAFESVVDVLPLAAPDVEPSAALKGRLMQRIQPVPNAKTAVLPQSPAPRNTLQQQMTRLAGIFTRPRWRAVAVLTVLALLIGAFFFVRQINAPPRQFVLTPTDAAPAAQGIIEVVGNGRQATLTVTGLPELDPASQYQLWLIKDGQRTSGGVFSVNTDGSQNVTIDAPQPLVEYAAFGITIEPAGGSPGPTGKRVLGFNL